MIEQPKRSLRVRKNPKYLNSDEEDPDKVSFSQLKSANDYASSNAQKTQDAKILLKFLNKVNKNFRAYDNERILAGANPEKSEIASRDKKGEGHSETAKKGTSSAKESKADNSKKSKSMYSFKKDAQQLKNTESYVNRLKEMSSLSSVSGTGKGLCMDQLKKLQSLYPDMNEMNYQQLSQLSNPNLFSSSAGGDKKKKEERQRAKASRNSLVDEPTANKLFKRSSYHVAIAYHIYLKNLKDKGNLVGQEIDPTYHAKKLKEQRPPE